MNPIKTKESNFNYLGPNGEIADLPCRVEGSNTFCVWEPSKAERELIASGANIRMAIYNARPIPPVSLQVAVNQGPYERVPSPCSVCGNEVDSPVHLSGPGTHAFKV